MPPQKSTIVIDNDASNAEIRDAVEELLEKLIEVPVRLRAKDVRTFRAAIETEKKRDRKAPKTRRAGSKGDDERFS
jgi:hypothetical protein